ncbi:MAG: hypothetical protein HC842_03805 [Cytophagales bacterium]|nr:hypothetical protein [Cytophagales bacterium]
MLKTQIIFEQSPWLTLAAAGLGVAFALGLYWRSGSHPWPRPVHFILATLRGLLVFVLTLLLLEPLIRYLRTEYEAPRLVLAVDNSESVLKLSPSNQTATLAEGLALRTKNATWAGHQVDIVYLHGQSLSDTALSSNFDAFLQK